METLVALVGELFSTDILLYVGMIVEGVLSIFLWKKSGKANTNIVESDLQSLIDYHEKVLKTLKQKFNK